MTFEEHDRETKAWRAQFLCEQADRLDLHAKKLMEQAQSYREMAQRINPTTAEPFP